MHSWGNRARGSRAGALVAAGVLSAALIGTGTGPVLAGTGLTNTGVTSTRLAGKAAWKVASTPDATLPGGQIESVSCPAAGDCMAVGNAVSTSGIYVTLAEHWNGTSWKRVSTPDPAEDSAASVRPILSGVSCAASTSCEAVGYYNLGEYTTVSLAEGWNGKRWVKQAFPLPSGALSVQPEQVSCVSASDCEAVGSYTDGSSDTVPLAEKWNGTAWRIQHAASPVTSGTVELTAVSCASATFCAAWGGGTGADPGPTVVEKWNGSAWRLQTVPSGASTNTYVNTVSCASATFCEAAGLSNNNDTAFRWNGSVWTAQTLPTMGSYTPYTAGVSCLSATFCEAVGDYTAGDVNQATALRWTGTAWTVQPVPSPGATTDVYMQAISCATTGACEAAGYTHASYFGNVPRALAVGWNGTAWASQQAATPPGATSNTLAGLSCPATTFCMSVGSYTDSQGNSLNLAESWNGTTWTIRPTPDPKSPYAAIGDSFNGVSCTSASFCEAVGDGPDGAAAEGWNGTSWKAQAMPSEGLEASSVSCVSESFCVAVTTNGRDDLWNGTAWSAGPAVPDLSTVLAVSCVSATDCEAIGFNQETGDAAVKWNGISWAEQATPGGTSLTAVSCASASYCEAVGGVSYESGATPQAEVWNGSAWSAQAVPAPPGTAGAYLNGVACTAADACTAVGQNATGTDGPEQTLAAVWNGTAWTLQYPVNNTSADQTTLSGVSCAAAAMCVAVGSTQDTGQLAANLTEDGD